MGNNSSFYKDLNSQTLTYLEFGSINIATSEKQIWDFRLHQEAYDFLMLSRYMKDLVTFKQLASDVEGSTLDHQLSIYLKNVYTHDLYNSFSKLAAIHVLCRNKSAPDFVELGSTLMGCIEAMEFLQRRGNSSDTSFSNIDLTNVMYHGIDISDLLNSVAVIVHPGHKLETYVDWKSINFNFDIFFAKGVSMLYALSTAPELAQLLSQAKLGIFDYSLSLSGDQEQHLGTGKLVRYLDVPSTLSALKTLSPSKNLWIHAPSAHIDKNKNRLRAMFLYGEDDLVTETLLEEERLRQNLLHQVSDQTLKKYLYYLDTESDLYQGYMILDNYLSSEL